MSESLVGIRHLVGILTFLDRSATVVVGVVQLAGQLLGHGLAGTLLRETDQPANRQGVTTVGETSTGT